METPINILSIGFACQHLQRPIGLIRATADRLGIRASSINGVVHFSEEDVELIRQAIVSELQSRESAVHDQRGGIM